MLTLQEAKEMVNVVEASRQSNTQEGQIDLVVEGSPMLDESMLDQIPEFIREEYDEDKRKPLLDPKPMLPDPKPMLPSIEVLSRQAEADPVPLSVNWKESSAPSPSQSPPADELEALWPGVHHELIQPAKRTPSFYLMLGFMAGAVVSLLTVWSYSAISAKIAAGNDAQAKQIVVAGTPKQEAPQNGGAQVEVKNVDPNATIVPISSTYEVKSGDTLAVIATKNYKKVTPRLLDEIVRVNGLKSAHLLNLGQKLQLPDYKPQSSRIAASASPGQDVH